MRLKVVLALESLLVLRTELVLVVQQILVLGSRPVLRLVLKLAERLVARLVVKLVLKLVLKLEWRPVSEYKFEACHQNRTGNYHQQRPYQVLPWSSQRLVHGR